VSWTITVTTEGFLFVDAINGMPVGDGGTGTRDNPWKSIADWYEGSDEASLGRRSYAGSFLYWREGTYPIDGYTDASNSNRFLGRDGNKPNVWLAYPGESPVIDFNGAYINYWDGDNMYLDGFEFMVDGNERGMGVVVAGGSSNVTVRRNTFHGIIGGWNGGNNALFFITSASAGNEGSYWSFQDNVFHDVDVGYGILGYSADHVLVEDNVYHDIGTHAVGPKEGTQMWFIRRNRFSSNGLDSIGLQYADSRGTLSGDIEISFNYVESGGGGVRVNSNQTTSGKPVYTYRNTFVSSAQQAMVTATNGPFYWTSNIIINDEWAEYPDRINTQHNLLEPSRYVLSDNLTGGTADHIVDADGQLTTAFAGYLGTHGMQIE
jgi:hypothetical protein